MSMEVIGIYKSRETPDCVILHTIPRVSTGHLGKIYDIIMIEYQENNICSIDMHVSSELYGYDIGIDYVITPHTINSDAILYLDMIIKEILVNTDASLIIPKHFDASLEYLGNDMMELALLRGIVKIDLKRTSIDHIGVGEIHISTNESDNVYDINDIEKYSGNLSIQQINIIKKYRKDIFQQLPADLHLLTL